jgi:hypothetical protein
MIPTTTRYAPNSPQTPARQTAPAAQRQGYTAGEYAQGTKLLSEFQDRINNRRFTSNAEIWEFLADAKKQYRRYSEILNHLLMLKMSRETYIRFLGNLEKAADPELQPAFQEFTEQTKGLLIYKFKSTLTPIIKNFLSLQNGFDDIIRQIRQNPPSLKHP